MNLLFRATTPAVFFAAMLAAQHAPAANPNILTDPNLNDITYSGAKTLDTVNGQVVYFGEFGRSGSTLTVNGWSTSGYNFVYAPGTVDSGTNASGANSTGTSTYAPREAPGEYNVGGTGYSAGYGSTYMWGSNNTGSTVWGSAQGSGLANANPFAGNFFAADGIFNAAAITQSVSGLQIGKVYSLTFYSGLAQQQGYTGGNTGNWKVTIDTATFATPTATITQGTFSGWTAQSFAFQATSATATLSFLAQGGSGGQPPFLVMGAPYLGLVPEPSSLMALGGLSALLGGGWLVRRRRRLATGE